MKYINNEPSLFDPPDAEPEPSTWQEVPQERFLSWSPEMQRAYCARRDEDSARHADSDWWREFYIERTKVWK